MAIPKILGTETEYGIIGRNDPDFDPISRTLLLINSYQCETPPPSLWDYTRESLRFDPQAMSFDDIYDVPDQLDPLSINKVLLNGARYYLDHAHPDMQRPNARPSATSSAMKRRGIVFLSIAVSLRNRS